MSHDVRSTHQSYNHHVTDYDTLVKFVRPLSKTIKHDLDQTVSLARRAKFKSAIKLHNKQ